MTSVLRILLTMALALCGVFFALLLAMKAKHGAGVMALVQPAAAVGVSIWLIRQMWQGRAVRPAGAKPASRHRNTQVIAVGLVLGLGAPLLLTWILR